MYLDVSPVDRFLWFEKIPNVEGSLADEAVWDRLRTLLPERTGFPTTVPVVAAKTLYKRERNWWKAFLLVEPAYQGQGRRQLRLYGWQWSKKAGAWKLKQKYNFPRGRPLRFIITVLETFAGKASSRKEASEVESLISRISELEADLENTHRENARNRLPEMESKTRDFERMLTAKRTKERDLQTFLRKQYWMFGPQYVHLTHERRAGLKGRNDFLLERSNGFHDVVELKLPGPRLFLGSPPKMSSDLKNAVSQMVSYLHYYYRFYLYDREETQQDVLYPRGLIVIGRRKDSERQTLEAHNAVLHRIEILTYDDVLDRAKQTLRSIRRRRTRRSPGVGRPARALSQTPPHAYGLGRDGGRHSD